MADINVRLNQKITGGAYETMHHETKTNLCIHDGNNLETEVGTLKTAVDTGNSLYIDKSAFDIEKGKYASKSIDNEEWIDLPKVASDNYVYSEGYSVRLKRTAVNTFVIEGKFKFKEYPTVFQDYIVLCNLPNVGYPNNRYFIIFDKTSGTYNPYTVAYGYLDATYEQEIRLNAFYLSDEVTKSNWLDSTKNNKEFSFRMEIYKE